jgi:hypothetical protein
MGQPTLQATSVQRATGEVLNAVDAPEVLGCADGARPGRSPPQALEAVTVGMAKRLSPWGRDA